MAWYLFFYKSAVRFQASMWNIFFLAQQSNLINECMSLTSGAFDSIPCDQSKWFECNIKSNNKISDNLHTTCSYTGTS